MLAWRFTGFGVRKVKGAQKARSFVGTRIRALSLGLFLFFTGSTIADRAQLAQVRPRQAEMTDKTSSEHTGATKFIAADTAVAAALSLAVDANGYPPSAAWEKANPVRFDADWQGNHADPQRATEVRLLWTPTIFYIKFISHYRSITVFSDSKSNGRRDQLWDRDVAEVFLQPDPSNQHRYKEFEISPNGFWIDLDIGDGGLQDLKSGLHRRVSIDEPSKIWTAELAIPMNSLLQQFDPHATWRGNFYRVEGPGEPRFYSAWRPTNSPKPNFHVPQRFGYLKFAPANQ
jgi:Carbohydrate family 9 binding domain-like